MRKAWSLPVALLCVTASACAAEQTTWTGTISDALCGAANHMWDEHHAMTEQECTLSCIKQGSKYVFVSENRVYAIREQGNPELARYAGQTVELTGHIDDEAIVVARIDAPGPT